MGLCGCGRGGQLGGCGGQLGGCRRGGQLGGCGRGGQLGCVGVEFNWAGVGGLPFVWA